MSKGKNQYGPYIGIAVLALVIAGVAMFPSAGKLFGGTTEYQKKSFYGGFYAGTGRQFEVDRDGLFSTSRAATFAALLNATGSTTVETFTQGGGTRATSTDDTSATLLAADIDVENVVEFTPNVTGITLSLPASSTLSSIVPNASDCRDITIINATSTAGASFTLAGGTGTLLRKASTTAAVLPGGAAVLRVCRKADTDIIANFYSTI